MAHLDAGREATSLPSSMPSERALPADRATGRSRSRSRSRGRAPDPAGVGQVDLGLAGELGPVAIRGARSVVRRLVAGGVAPGSARLGAFRTAGGTECAQLRPGVGTLIVQEGDEVWAAGNSEPVVQLRIHDERTFAAWLAKGSVGLGESYVAGWWDVDDLTSLVRILLRATGPLRAQLDRFGRVTSKVVTPVARHRSGDLVRDRREVQAHYDLPGELFETMLDETMTYSCAVFERPGMSLAEAQRAKLDRLCRKLELSAADHLVEIGTGWGALALHAAERYGCRVTTTTISDAQREVASKRVAEAGLADRVTVLGVDYRELPGRYDKLVSVEMIEAVSWRDHDAFFRACSDLLVPDGLMALQAITIDDRSFERAKLHDDFIRALIFPGGCIPSVEAISRTVVRVTDLSIVDVEDIGRHYAETLRRWHVAVNAPASRERLEEAGLDRQFRRLWNLYLCYCEGAFLERHISDVQIVLAKPGREMGLSTRAV